MPALPALYEQMYARRVFTTDEAVGATGLPKEQVVRQLSYLQSEGYFDKIRRGLYAVVPLESRGKPAMVNPYLLASRLAHPYVLSYHTGLELHGVAQSTFNRVFVLTPQRVEPLEYQGMAYQMVHAKEEEVRESSTTTTLEDQRVAVATREWTVVHCAHRLDFAGGLEELLKSVGNFAYLTPAALASAAKFLGHKVLYNRLGFLLDYFGDKWDVSERDLETFRDRMAREPSYFGTKPGQARYVKQWQLMVPDNLDQVMRPA
jgi:predicted transcriptional regulator of viral defense system